MKDFTHDEKKAISKVLADLIRADGVVDIGEAESLYRISLALGINTQIQDEAMKMSSEEAIKVLQELPREKKAKAVKFLHSMADADGNIDPKEMELISKVIYP